MTDPREYTALDLPGVVTVHPDGAVTLTIDVRILDAHIGEWSGAVDDFACPLYTDDQIAADRNAVAAAVAARIAKAPVEVQL